MFAYAHYNEKTSKDKTSCKFFISFAGKQQKKEADEFIAELNKNLNGKIVTEGFPLKAFFEAEGYHHNYFKNCPLASYCQFIIWPKMSKLRREFAELLVK